MELKEIKQQLSILEVLQYYGLRPDKNQRLRCPFHPDKTPSLQVYPKTNTWCCFSSNCHAGTGDAIQFIELIEKCTKHEAIMKAQGMAGLQEPVVKQNGQPVQPEKPRVAEAETLVREAVLSKLFKYFVKALPLSKKAVDYLQSRAISYKDHEAGYNTGDWHHKLNEKNFLKSCEQYGLLKPRAAAGYNVWAKDCIIFPLKNEEGKIISLYGRSTTNPETSSGQAAHASRHFYLQNRSGLYPGYPSMQTKKLILCESIIDAASLLQQKEIAETFAVLALYGTNGLTDEHQKAIINWATTGSLPEHDSDREIIFMLDADEAGDAATAKHTVTLKQLLPTIKISKANLPAGEDINSLLQSHSDPQILSDLIEQRIDFSFYSQHNHFLDGVRETASLSSIEKEKIHSSETTAILATQGNSKLNTQNPELLIYDSNDLFFEILGGIRITGLDRMKVTLKVQHATKQLLPIRDTLDLYNRGQTEQLIQTISENFDANIKQTETAISELTGELENYRLEKIEALQPKEKQPYEMTPAARAAAMNELKKPNLLQRTGQLLMQCGIVGEQTNSLIAYLVYCTRKQNIPLHIMFLGSSGSGKTYLQERISELIPEEDKIEITQITENALYYFRQEELKNKLILIEDLDGAMSVFYPLRELQTKRKISKTVTLKDSKGNLKTITLTVEGPVCVSGCTTKEKIYEDNANRCLLLYTDQSREQDKRINEYQTKIAAGEINREREAQYRELFKNMQRLLQPLNIINPYAKYIELPEPVFKPRRTMTLLLGFIEAITFYHQYQREVKWSEATSRPLLGKDTNREPYIETTVEDIASAFELLKDVLFSKSDELSQATRTFFESLKSYLTETGQPSFTPQQIRKIFRIEPRTIQRYIRELKQYGFLKAVSGFKHRKGYEYSITDAEEYSQLKSGIDGHLASILAKLRAHAYCDSDNTATVVQLSQ